MCPNKFVEKPLNCSQILTSECTSIVEFKKVSLKTISRFFLFFWNTILLEGDVIVKYWNNWVILSYYTHIYIIQYNQQNYKNSIIITKHTNNNHNYFKFFLIFYIHFSDLFSSQYLLKSPKIMDKIMKG